MKKVDPTQEQSQLSDQPDKSNSLNKDTQLFLDISLKAQYGRIKQAFMDRSNGISTYQFEYDYNISRVATRINELRHKQSLNIQRFLKTTHDSRGRLHPKVAHYYLFAGKYRDKWSKKKILSEVVILNGDNNHE